MTQLNSLTATSNSFSFDLLTSSGDRISMSLYDNRELSVQSAQSGDFASFSMSLKHEYGYSFSYSGNGIDERDMAEIEKAMKIIKPMFNKFLQSVQKSEEINDDMLNMLKSSTVDTMDEVLSAFEKSRALIESTKRLFDRIFEKMDGFEIYA